MDTQEPEKKPEDGAALRLYAALAAALALCLVPAAEAAALSAVLFTGALVAAYVVRRKNPPDSLAANHASFIIRTIWIASLFAAVTSGLASVWIISLYDPAPIHDCVNQVMAGADVEEIAGPCMDKFIAVNRALFVTGAVAAGAPVVLYMIWRLLKGLSRARRGYRIADVKKWF